MSNMPYCRFRNTLADLRDCLENIEDELSRGESRARRELIKLCFEIASQFMDDEGELNIEMIDELPEE